MKQVDVSIFYTYFTVDRRLTPEVVIENDMSRIRDYLSSYKLEWNPKYRRPFRKLDRYWFYFNQREGKYYFPIAVLKMVLKELSGLGYKISNDNVKVYRDINILPMKGNFKHDVFKLRDYQNSYQEAMTNEKSPMFNLVDLKTGAGKTLIGFYVMTKMKQRIGIVLHPKYIEKWIEDVVKYTDIPSSRVYVVQGGPNFEKLMREPNPDYDIIIFSIRTLQLQIKAYETGEDYTMVPYEIFNHLNIGVLLSDESHQELAALSRIIMYSNVKKVIGLSATFLSHEEDVRKFQYLLFPEATRISNIVKFDAHIDAFSCPYRINRSIRLKYKRQKQYSHVLFEQSIMSNTRLLHDYLDMMDHYFKIGYYKRRKPGQKCLFFFSTIRMCTYAYKYFESKYGKSKENKNGLEVRRYVEDDTYESMLEGDIIISTILSTGTAIDIPNLVAVFQTVCVKSAIANIQSSGRLRKIEGEVTEFYSIYCSTVDSHAGLQKMREETLKRQVRGWTQIPYKDTLAENVWGKRFHSLY